MMYTSYKKYKIIGEVKDRCKAIMQKETLKGKKIWKNLRKVREDIKIKLSIHNNECSMIKECRDLGKKEHSKRQRYIFLGLMKSMSFQIYEA